MFDDMPPRLVLQQGLATATTKSNHLKRRHPFHKWQMAFHKMPEFYAKFVTFMETEMGYTSEYAKESASIIMSRAFEKKQSAFQPFFRRMHLRASEQGGE